MNVYIDIIDTVNDEHVTSLENAGKNSVRLKYAGKDTLDELMLVGSSLAFTILLPIAENEDAALIELFTNDESRYRVEMRTETDDILIWNGFLLPDSYREPYKNGNLPIGLEATDGLGRLKGKFLPDDYYSEEKNIIDIVCQCLQLTNLEMPLVFAPGIENTVEKNWHNIYVDTSNFIDDDKKEDAKTILESIIETTVSCVYQHLGKWYVEGYNKRTKQSYDAKLYDYEGNFESNTTIEKVVRAVDGKFLASPNVTAIPAFGQITVDTEQLPLAFDEQVAKEKNEGWSPAVGVVEEIYATQWFHAHAYDFFAKAKAPDYKIYFESLNDTETPVGFEFVQLLRKIYIKKNDKIKLVIGFEIDYYGNEKASKIEDLISDGDWTNPFLYYVYFGTQLLFTNSTTNSSIYTRPIQFGTDKKATLTLDFIAQDSRLLNIFIRQPHLDISAVKIQGVYLDTLTIENVFFNETSTYTETLIDDYTVTKEIELPFTDDAYGVSKAFRLFRVNTLHTSYGEITVPIISAFSQNGKYYCVVQLDGANIIKDNIASVYYSEALVTINEVIYNYNSGEQMVVETATEITSGSFMVRQYRLINQDLDRSAWERWTDSVYALEAKRLGEAVLGVYSRLFNAAYPMVDGTINKVPVLFNDLLQFNYIEDTIFIPTYLDLDLDSGKVAVRMSKSNYLVENTLVPPYVDVGPDLFLTSGSTISVDATAFDPDGTIVSYLWEQVSGDTTATIVNANAEDATFFLLTGNNYEFKLTVTDNDALTASDTLKITRVINYTADLNLIDSGSTTDDISVEYYEVYRVVISPTLQESDTIILNSNYQLFTSISDVYNGSDLADFVYAELTLTKNSNVLETFFVSNGFDTTGNFTVSYIDGDVIDVALKVYASGFSLYSSQARAVYTLDNASVVDNPGVVNGLPQTREIERERG